MEDNNRGVGWSVGVAVLGLIVVAGGLAIGITAGVDDPTGEDILNETATQYEDADGILTQGSVTVETENATMTRDFEVVATANNKTLFSVTDGNETVTTAATEEFVWVTADNAQAYFYADNDSVGVYTLAGIEIVAIDQDNLSSEFDLPAEHPAPDELNESAVEAAVDGLLNEFENSSTTAFNESFGDDIIEQIPAAKNLSATEFNETAPEKFPTVKNASDRPTADEIATAVEEGTLQDELDENVTAAIEELSAINSTDELRAAVAENTTVELIETTTLADTEVHVVSVTHTDTDGEARYWIGTETNEIVKQEVTTSDVTVTVEGETEFNPDVQDSTFEPPATTPDELTSFDAVQERTFFEATGAEDLTAVVGNTTEMYTFDSGTVVSVPIGDGQLASSVYEGDQTVTLVETDTALPLPDGDIDEAAVTERTIAETNVTVVEGAEVDARFPGVDDIDADTVSVATWTTEETTVILATAGEAESTTAVAEAVLEQ